MTMPDWECRLSKLEQRVDTHDETLIERRRRDDDIMLSLKNIELNQARMQTVGAGVAAVFLGAGALIGFLWDKVFFK